jgi:hypothetical protein
MINLMVLCAGFGNMKCTLNPGKVSCFLSIHAPWTSKDDPAIDHNTDKKHHGVKQVLPVLMNGSQIMYITSQVLSSQAVAACSRKDRIEVHSD